MTLTFKKIFAPLVLASFLIMAFFSFATMSSEPDGSMQGNCPFSVAGASLCPQGVLPSVTHHISASQAFLSVPINSSFTALVIALMTAVLAIIFSIRPLLFRPLAYVSYRSPPFTSQDRKIKRWLSLFENSPSL